MLGRLFEAQTDLSSFRRIQRRSVEPTEIARFLHLAWASETQFRLSHLADSSLLQYSNAWAPVHAYYAVYMSLQAWLACMGEDQVDSHTAALNVVANFVARRSLFPRPWSVTCTGCPHLKENEFHGLPGGVQIDPNVELLANPTLDTFWSRYAKLLEKTRERRLERNLDEWKRRNRRKNTRADEKRQVAAALLPTTIFDFFWRLRVRSNYRDVRSFLTTAVDGWWQEEFRDSLEILMEGTMLLLESLVVAYAGPAVIRDTAEAFSRSVRDLPELRDPLRLRVEITAGAGSPPV